MERQNLRRFQIICLPRRRKPDSSFEIGKTQQLPASDNNNHGCKKRQIGLKTPGTKIVSRQVKRRVRERWAINELPILVGKNSIAMQKARISHAPS